MNLTCYALKHGQNSFVFPRSKKKNEDHKQRMFNLVMIDPTSEIFSTQKQYDQFVEKSRVYHELAAEFSKSMFEKNDVIESNCLSLQTDTLILILGTTQTLKQLEKHITFIKPKHVFVISALKYQ